MDKFDSNLVNLHDTRADQSNLTGVHLRSTQEGATMLQAEVVDRIRELAGQGLGTKRIARRLGISRNTVRRYLTGAPVGFHERPAARLLDAATRNQVTSGEAHDPREQRVFAALKRLQLTHLRDTLAAVLSEAAKEGWTYLEFLDQILWREVDSKQGERIRMGMQIAHSPYVRTIEEFDSRPKPRWTRG